MKLGDCDAHSLGAWMAQTLHAPANTPVELHGVGRGWELRCDGLRPFPIQPTPELRVLDELPPP
jgi:hypothetical protein